MKMKRFLYVWVIPVVIYAGCSPKFSSNKVFTPEKAESKMHHIVLFNFKENAPLDTIEASM